MFYKTFAYRDFGQRVKKKYFKNLCISCTFLLKYWAQNHGCGLYTRPFDHGAVKLLIRDKFFSNQYSSGVLTIYMGKPEIPVGRSNGSRHSVWEASENLGFDLW